MKKTLQFVMVVLIVGCGSILQAQNQKDHKKTSHVDSTGNYYQHVDLPVYLYISTSPNDVNPTPLKEERNKEIKPIYLDGPGIHHLKHIDDHHKRIDVYLVHADAKAPNSTLKVSNTPFYKSKDGQIFYGKNPTVTLSANDDMSGVNKKFISLNNKEYVEYSGKEDYSNEGEYTIKFYSVDNVGNVEKVNNNTFTIDSTPPTTFHNIIGIASGRTISASSRIYLDRSDKGSGIEATYYSFDEEAPKLLTGKEINFKYLDNGEHTLHYWSIDKVKNEETKQSFTFFLDKIAPIASIDFLGDKFIVNDKIYFSGRTKVKITAVDNRSGIKELKYSLNNSIYREYTEPFYMPNKAGLYTIKYYAIDDTDNKNEDEGMHSRGVVYVDLSGPILNYQFEGPIFKKGKSTFIGAKTKFVLLGKDSESGLQYLAYSLNNSNEEIRYTQPFCIKNNDGEYTVTYIGYDNVNNRNQNEVKITLDTKGPDIDIRYSTEPEKNENGEAIYPSYVQLFLSATDIKTTVASIHYSINNGKEIYYKSPIQGFEPNRKYSVKVIAKDVLDNETIQEINFQTGIY